MTRRLPRTRRGRLAAFVALALVVIAAVAIGVATSALPPEAGPTVNSHADNSDIYVVDTQSRELTQETVNAEAREPAFSSDGEIAFSTDDCDECLSKIHVDAGTSEVSVDTTVPDLYQPSWAPDGRRVAVVRLGLGIYVIDTSSGAAKRLTAGASDETPAWSPNGDWIVYVKLLRNSNYELHAVHAETGERRRITQDPSAQTNPAWSPDGSRLAFAEQQSNGKWAIFTMGFDGNGRRRVTGSQISAQDPSWSPDGKKIAFILQESDQATVASIDADGSSSAAPLTEPSLFPSNPTWSPDGTRIAFSATVVP